MTTVDSRQGDLLASLTEHPVRHPAPGVMRPEVIDRRGRRVLVHSDIPGHPDAWCIAYQVPLYGKHSFGNSGYLWRWTVEFDDHGAALDAYQGSPDAYRSTRHPGPSEREWLDALLTQGVTP